MKLALRTLLLLLMVSLSTGLVAAKGGEEASGETEAYNPVETIMHHIGDGNEFEIVHGVAIPLPVILYAPSPGPGWTFGLSSMFHHGEEAVDGYVMNHGRVNRIVGDFPAGHVKLEGDHGHFVHHAEEEGGKDYVMHGGQKFELDRASAADGGLFGGGITSFYDFSITKNVFGMILAAILLFVLFGIVSAAYKKREGQAPSGLQSFMEPLFVFVREEVAIPMIGKEHYERFLPFIMSLFFFILFCNLLGLIPIFPGSANITGNLAVTMGLAILVFIVTNISGKKDYWQHVFWMPGVPVFVKPILAIVEILGLFIKPFSLMIRLFANITAGHIIILSLIGLVFVFGNSGESLGGATVGAIVGGAFTAFMNLIELLVAFLQAFIFAMLAASYIGAAVEEHDHHDEEHAVDHRHGSAYAESVAHH